MRRLEGQQESRTMRFIVCAMNDHVGDRLIIQLESEPSITGQRDSAWPCVNGDYEFSAKWHNFYSLPNSELLTDLLEFLCG